MNDIPTLSNAEWEILKPMWAEGPMAARDIFAACAAKNDWGYKTVKTMLARLVKKGVLNYDQIGNSYLYRAVYTRDEMTNAATGSFVQRVFDGALSPFLAQFAENVSKEELALLRRELRRIEQEKGMEDDSA